MKKLPWLTVFAFAAVTLPAAAAPLLDEIAPGAYSFTVGATGEYEIDAFGGQGSTCVCGGGAGGAGASMSGTFNLTAGEQLFIGVGATASNAGSSGTGGGASFVYYSQGGSAIPLLIAGGGGGGVANRFGGAQGGAGLAFSSGGTGGYIPGAGGTNGNDGSPGGTNAYYEGQGGTGWLTASAGGSPTAISGGFGFVGGGGGGGYSGGGGGGGNYFGSATYFGGAGGGGGSFIDLSSLVDGTETAISGGNTHSYGEVIITEISEVPEPSALAALVIGLAGLAAGQRWRSGRLKIA